MSHVHYTYVDTYKRKHAAIHVSMGVKLARDLCIYTTHYSSTQIHL